MHYEFQMVPETVSPCPVIVSTFRLSQDPELRKRNIPALQSPLDGDDQVNGSLGIENPTSKADNKSQQKQETGELVLPEAAEQPKDSLPVPGTWSPLLTSVCLCTALALSAYACYRAYFHWCLSFPFFFFVCLFVTPCSLHQCCKVDLAGQSACFDSGTEWTF